MWELRDCLVDASSVLARFGQVVEALGGVPVGARLAVLEQALTKALAPVDEPRLSAIERALAMLGERRGNVGVESVARRAGVTRRHLERRFQDEVGLGVKEMARLARLHAALALIERPSPPGAAEVAARCGFSDQAHLIRECRAWTGRTPARFATEATSLAGLIREPALA
jgi:transcriptional regulator GlxA family with amidase domain